MTIDPLDLSFRLDPAWYPAVIGNSINGIGRDTAVTLLSRIRARVDTLKRDPAEVEAKRAELATLERMIAASQDAKPKR